MTGHFTMLGVSKEIYQSNQQPAIFFCDDEEWPHEMTRK